MIGKTKRRVTNCGENTLIKISFSPVDFSHTQNNDDDDDEADSQQKERRRGNLHVNQRVKDRNRKSRHTHTQCAAFYPL